MVVNLQHDVCAVISLVVRESLSLPFHSAARMEIVVIAEFNVFYMVLLFRKQGLKV